METLKAKKIEKWVAMDSAPMCSASEKDEMFKDISYEYEIPKGFQNSNVNPEIEVVGPDGEHVTYLTPKNQIWCVDSAMGVFRLDNKEEHVKGWDYPAEPFYIVQSFASKKNAEEWVENMAENWGD